MFFCYVFLTQIKDFKEKLWSKKIDKHNNEYYYLVELSDDDELIKDFGIQKYIKKYLENDDNNNKPLKGCSFEIESVSEREFFAFSSLLKFIIESQEISSTSIRQNCYNFVRFIQNHGLFQEVDDNKWLPPRDSAPCQ